MLANISRLFGIAGIGRQIWSFLKGVESDEGERGGIYAVSQAGRLWAVFEDVSEVATAAVAMHFGPLHSVTGIDGAAEVFRSDRSVEAWPASTGIVLLFAREERGLATCADEDSWSFAVPIGIAEWWFRAVLAKYPVTVSVEQTLPFLVTLLISARRGCFSV